MYSYIWLRLRKLLKRVWFRYFASNRERTTSLHECLEPTTDQDGRLWRPWFVLMLLLPLLYYIIYVKVRTEDVSLNTASIRPAFREPELPIMPSTVHHYKKNIFATDIQFAARYDIPFNTGMLNLVKKKAMVTSKKLNAENPIWNNRNNLYINKTKWKTDLPWCKTEANPKEWAIVSRNVSSDQIYLDQVQRGGYYEPLYCRPKHKVALLVPFRDRDSNLAMFLYNMHPFLIDQKLQYRIFVIEQNGTELFNKGRLMNVGFLEALKYGNWDCMVFHDVDLLPINKQILYTCPTWPRHMCAAVLEANSLSNTQAFFGGVSSMSLQHFKKVNGYSNLYWGSGGEDSDMFWRLRAIGIPILRYNKNIAKYLSLPHTKHQERPDRHYLLKTAIDRYVVDGLSSLSYRIVSVKLTHLCTRILVDINPDGKGLAV